MHCHHGIVVLVLATSFVGGGCGGGEEARRPARSPANVEGRTTTTSAALTTTTGSNEASSSVPPSDGSTTVSAPVTPARVPPRVETSSAVMRLTTARCDREAACEHVGTGRAFADRDECTNAVGHDVVAALPDEDCPLGVDADRLATCVAEIGSRSCEAQRGAQDDDPASCARERICARP